MKWLSNKWLLVPHAVGLGVFFACQGVGSWFPAMKMDVFCRPAAALSALFLGVPVMDSAGGPLLMHRLIDVQVAESCSGFDFFSLLLAVFYGMAVRYGVRSSWRWTMFVPLAWAVTLLANVARIVCSVHLRVFSHSLPIGLSDDIIHFAVGAAIFATLLVACCYTMKRLYEYDTHCPSAH